MRTKQCQEHHRMWIGKSSQLSHAPISLIIDHSQFTTEVTMSKENESSQNGGFVSNGDKRLKLTDVDEETLDSGAEG
jgi:hypothetical protein